MQYAIALCLLITLVASQEGQTRTKGVREDLGFGYINSALRSRKLTKREASTVFLLSSWGRALQWKCIDSHAPNSIKILEVADSNLDSCTKGLKNPLPASPWVHNTSTTDYTHSLCRCYAGYWKCVKTELHECPIALYNYLDDLTKAVDPIYSPCPINRTV